MAYYTGTTTDLADLMSKLSAALLANGYSADGDVFYKGTIFVEIRIATMSTAPYDPYDRIEIRMGTGRSGSTLTGAPPVKNTPGYNTFDGTFCFAPVRGFTYIPFSFPSTYYILMNESPEEVYFFLNDDSTRWTYLCFGENNGINTPATGNWYAASTYRGYTEDVVGMPSLSKGILFGDSSFAGELYSAPPHVSSVNHGLDGMDWSLIGTEVGNLSATRWENTPSVLSSSIQTEALWSSQPNSWNNQSVLLRIQAFVNRGDSKVSLVVNTEHSRYIRLDNYVDGDIITLGSDKWKVFPFIRKNSSVRDGLSTTETAPIVHSGTYGIAIRYDGP